MDSEDNIFTKDKRFEGLVRRAKWVSLLRNIIISMIVSILIIFVIYFIGSFHMQSKIEKESNDDSYWYSIYGANIEERGTVYHYSLFSAVSKTERVKNVGGIPIPWGQREKVYPIFGRTQHSFTARPSGAGKIEDERMLMYVLGQRVIEFYHPEVEYKNRFDERFVLNNMNEQTVVEFAFSFDKGYSITEVNQIFEDHLEWYWIDTFDSADIQSYSEANKESTSSLDNTVLGEEAFGFKYLEDISAEMFIQTLHTLQENGGEYQSAVQELVARLTDNGSIELAPENLRIVGVVVSGPAEELKQYKDIPMIEGATLGAITQRYH